MHIRNPNKGPRFLDQVSIPRPPLKEAFCQGSEESADFFGLAAGLGRSRGPERSQLLVQDLGSIIGTLEGLGDYTSLNLNRPYSVLF